MKKILALTVLLLAVKAGAQNYCPSCIQNSGAPQNAQMNIASATVRGPLTVGQLSISTISASTVTAGNFVGDGSLLTNLSASNIASGILRAASLVGQYTGITGVGVLVNGVWNGSPVGTQYGGTGQNFVTALQGYLPFFSGTGIMSALPNGVAGQVLQTNGPGANPSWTGAPQVSGANVTAIPPANLAAGTLPPNVVVAAASISSVSGAQVSGNIAGNAGGLSNPLPLSGLQSGTLPTSVAASSVTPTGVAPGSYGSASQVAVLSVQSDGRVASASQQPIAISPSQIAGSGSLPSGVSVPAANVASGLLGPSVVASSLTATGAVPGTYGGPFQTATVVVRADGRLASASQQSIALPPANLTAGPLPSNVSVPATNLTGGLLGGDVVAQRLNATGVVGGTYGGPSQLAQITISTDGRIVSASQYLNQGGAVCSTCSTVSRFLDNAWAHSQTSLVGSSWTVNGPLQANNLVSGALDLVIGAVDWKLQAAGGGDFQLIDGSSGTLLEGQLQVGNGLVAELSTVTISRNLTIGNGVTPQPLDATDGFGLVVVGGGSFAGTADNGGELDLIASTSPAASMVEMRVFPPDDVNDPGAFAVAQGVAGQSNKPRVFEIKTGSVTIAQNLTIGNGTTPIPNNTEFGGRGLTVVGDTQLQGNAVITNATTSPLFNATTVAVYSPSALNVSTATTILTQLDLRIPYGDPGAFSPYIGFPSGSINSGANELLLYTQGESSNVVSASGQDSGLIWLGADPKLSPPDGSFGGIGSIAYVGDDGSGKAHFGLFTNARIGHQAEMDFTVGGHGNFTSVSISSGSGQGSNPAPGMIVSIPGAIYPISPGAFGGAYSVPALTVTGPNGVNNIPPMLWQTSITGETENHAIAFMDPQGGSYWEITGDTATPASPNSAPQDGNLYFRPAGQSTSTAVMKFASGASALSLDLEKDAVRVSTHLAISGAEFLQSNSVFPAPTNSSTTLLLNADFSAQFGPGAVGPVLGLPKASYAPGLNSLIVYTVGVTSTSVAPTSSGDATINLASCDVLKDPVNCPASGFTSQTLIGDDGAGSTQFNFYELARPGKRPQINFTMRPFGGNFVQSLHLDTGAVVANTPVSVQGASATVVINASVTDALATGQLFRIAKNWGGGYDDLNMMEGSDNSNITVDEEGPGGPAAGYSARAYDEGFGGANGYYQVSVSSGGRHNAAYPEAGSHGYFALNGFNGGTGPGGVPFSDWRAFMALNTTENWSGTAQGTNIGFQVTKNGTTSTNPVAVFDDAGLHMQDNPGWTSGNISASTATVTAFKMPTGAANGRVMASDAFGNGTWQSTSGLVGPAGATGATGPQGVTGATGSQGSQGVTGATGSAGVTGATGVQGLTGATGVQGVTGATGVSPFVSATGGKIYYNGGNVGIGTTNPIGLFVVNTSTLDVVISTNGYTDMPGGNAPTFTGCGTTPTVDSGSNDMRGGVTMTSGASSTCVIVPAAPTPSNYTCTISVFTGSLTVLAGQTAPTTVSCDNVSGLITCPSGTYMHWTCTGGN